jgi:hypothetical protein
MAEQPIDRTSYLVVSRHDPLIGVPAVQRGDQTTRFFASEVEANAALTPQAAEAPLSLAGSWRDLDWDLAVQELDHIRHDTPPTPALEV